MAPGPRERLLASAIALMRERGVHATGLSDLLEHSKTARGSIYQHFPGGKSELMEQATLRAGQVILQRFERLLADGTPADAVGALIGDWITILRATDFAHGCPILAAAQSGPSEPAIQAAAATVFEQWSGLIAAALVDRGAPQEHARSLASSVVAAVEGAIARSTAARSTTPLAEVRAILVPLVEQATQHRAPTTAS